MSGDADRDGAELTAPADQEGVAGTRIAAELAVLAASRYEPLGELARGGAGRIVRARDLAFDRIVALKEPLDPVHGGARLRAEAAILASLQHPSIVPVYDHGTRVDGVPFFAMKLVEGRSLRDVIRDAPALEQRLALIPQVVAVAEAVAYAHAQGVIHRDLKPANVLVGAFGETIVIDWGIAKTLASEATVDARVPAREPSTPVPASATVTGAIMGTPAYMAPEQAHGEHVDARADVYALGAILYHVLAGAAPYAGRGDVITAVLEGPPEPIEQLQQRVPADLAAIVTKAMAREPRDRYPTASGLAEDLVRFQTGRLVAARRYSPFARARRLVRRRAGWFAAGGLAVASAAIAAVAVPTDAPAPGAQCARAGDAVHAKVWSPARRQQVIDAFAAIGKPYAAGVVQGLLPRIDRAADALGRARIEACEATEARGERTQTQLAQQMSCLDQQVAQLDATIDLLTTADAAILDVAPRAARSFDDVAVCADVKRLALAPIEPADEATQQQLRELRTRLAAVFTAMTWRREGDVVAESRAISAEATKIGYCPIAVQADYQLAASLARSSGDQAQTDDAIARLRQVVLDADACGDDYLRAKALITLLETWPHDDAAGLALLQGQAEAAARRIDSPATQIRLRTVLAGVANQLGHPDRAIAHP